MGRLTLNRDSIAYGLVSLLELKGEGGEAAGFLCSFFLSLVYNEEPPAIMSCPCAGLYNEPSELRSPNSSSSKLFVYNALI